MDREVLLEHLEQARRHVAEGRDHLARQQRLIDRLRKQGHPTAMAEAVLRELQGSQANHLDGVRRIERELAMPRHPLMAD